MILSILSILIVITIFTNFLLIGWWLLNFRGESAAAQSEYPRMAVLLAVRNEEKRLENCLNGLLALHYPADKLRIWVGNDASEDATLAIAQRYAIQDARVQVVDAGAPLGKARAKANVLAHLAQANAHSETPADLLLITDADMTLQPQWAEGMLRSWQTGKERTVGVVTGITWVAGRTPWAVWQRIDWLFALGMVKVVSDWGVPVATMGNNMMLYRLAYEATGGYENLPFSITEDFQIFHEVMKYNYDFQNVIHPDVMLKTQPMPTLSELLEQRKRWMQGAVRLPWPLVTILSLQAAFFPLVLILCWFSPALAAGLWATKVATQSLFIILVLRKLKLSAAEWRSTLWQLVPYELYSSVVSMATVAHHLLPTKMAWKGRKY